ncbi:tRNA-uridine aminocarboxypropyltransferase [Scleromatobacter humisilvae]|uniref:tRNA-uridine aminocarboxypropyltransferase n=1 Tax=Scleromatobacter humisilvae TaxID=2897159 RepID=A0A9X1YMG5_9BURK|nr:tRNA-uridine aminocarboxypropyltransferase [Scleromatobacter humisilvae]MCK9688868.1 DTW domain-containing protein [Scleromatobacter humisilvae]
MTDTPPSSTRRARCERCGLPARTCVCALVPRVDNMVEVLVLQHPDEAGEAKNSARLLRLGLVRCRAVVGEFFEPAALLALLDGDVSGSALLYPADTAAGTGLTQIFAPPAPPARLVVLDGTWRKSLRMLHANPLLQSLPRWVIEPPAPARYAALRKARRPAQLSTLEAACAALARIEDAPGRYAPLLAAFDRFVADGASRASRGRGPE